MCHRPGARTQGGEALIRWHARLLLIVVIAVWIAPRVSWARVVRYAVLIGNNAGDADETTLRYAERDATRVYDVLRTLGGFHEENLVVLHGRDRDTVQRVLISINARIRSVTGSGDQAVLFVYYSGHADADALHLGGERFPIARLQELLRGSPADFRMLLLDSCRSGAVTRVKGGQQAPAFKVAIDERLAGEGLVFLTSSATNEDSQESDNLRGSFFTHYFVSGLVGAADIDGDGDITLAEAYQYAYDHTIRATSATLYGTQHPTFQFDVRGQGGIVLTRVREVARGHARLRFPPGRTYLLFSDGPEGAVVAEVGVHDATRTITVRAGKYFVRGRTRDHLLEGHITVRERTTRDVTDDTLKRVEYARLVRKGGSVTHAHGPLIGYQFRTPLWQQSGLCHGARVGYPVDMRWVSISTSVGFCRAGFTADRLTVKADQYDIELVAAYVFDLPVVSVALGLGGGLSYLRQTFETQGIAPPRNTIGGYGEALLMLRVGLPRGFYFAASVAAQVQIFSQQLANQDSATTRAAFTARPVFGVGKWF